MARERTQIHIVAVNAPDPRALPVEIALALPTMKKLLEADGRGRSQMPEVCSSALECRESV